MSTARPGSTSLRSATTVGSIPKGAALSLARYAGPLAALAYPLLLDAFHREVSGPVRPIAAASLLLLALGMPAVGYVRAAGSLSRERVSQREFRLRLLALAAVAAPPLYVLLGVLQAMVRSPAPDEWVWTTAWVGLTVWAAGGASAERVATSRRPGGRLRVAHGVCAGLVLLFVGFHLANHLTGLLGAEVQGAIMRQGRIVYRAPLVEPILVGAVLFQAGSGLLLAARTLAFPMSWSRAFQLASGVYMAAFILCHLNSVFVRARFMLHLDTNWAYASGAPSGLIHDPWNIRLLPHYAFAAFLVLGHLASGLRQVAEAHGAPPRLTGPLWAGGLVLSAVVSAAIVLALSGFRLTYGGT
jgi:hypothetical protein